MCITSSAVTMRDSGKNHHCWCIVGSMSHFFTFVHLMGSSSKKQIGRQWLLVWALKSITINKVTQICTWLWKQCGTYGMNRFRHDAQLFYIAHCNKLFWNNTIFITCCQLLCFISFTVSHDWLWFRRVHPRPLFSCCIGSDSHLMMSHLLSCHSSCYGNRSQGSEEVFQK